MSFSSGLYGAEYRRRRQILFASKTSESVCWRCGELERPGDRFESGHVIDGHRASPLAFEHRSCNRRSGGELSQRVEVSPASRDWTS